MARIRDGLVVDDPQDQRPVSISAWAAGPGRDGSVAMAFVPDTLSSRWKKTFEPTVEINNRPVPLFGYKSPKVILEYRSDIT